MSPYSKVTDMDAGEKRLMLVSIAAMQVDSAAAKAVSDKLMRELERVQQEAIDAFEKIAMGQ